MKNQFKTFIGSLAVLLFVIAGCKEMDDTYEDFIKKGETVYIGKADSLLLRGGNNRIELSWLLISDPKVHKYKVYWNNRRDSAENLVTKTNSVDTVRLSIDNLPEGTHHFEVFLFDKNGNSSVKVTGIGKVYGERYKASLLTRAYRTITRKGSDLMISWMPADESLKEVLVEYVNINQERVVKKLSRTATLDTLRNFPLGGKFTYRSVFLPEKLALDEFSTEAEEVVEVLTEVQLDKSSWTNAALPTDTYKSEFPDWKISNLWDGITNVNPNFFYQDPNIPGLALPNWFTIDIGSKSKLTKIIVNQLSHSDAWLYNYGAPKTFEIYGSNEPPADGSWANWTLLGQFESIKPSNGPTGVLSAEDVARGRAGEQFAFPESISSYRYIRFKTNSTWGGNKNVMISEITLRGYPF